MKGTVLFTVLVGLNIVCTAIACDDAQPLPDKERRARNYQADGELGGDPWVNDQYTGPGWFNVGDYRMPDSSTKPNLEWCGTRQSIYIADKHPDVGVLDNTPVIVGVCEVGPISDCDNSWDIEVRKCDNDIHYYLPRTGQNAAYCLDPPELQAITEFDSAPDVQLGTLTVVPELAFRLHNGNELPFLIFNCIESPIVDRSSENFLYSTYWFVDSTLTKSFERNNQTVSISETELIDNGYTLGFLIRCGVRVSTSSTGIQTNMVSSGDFFAGVKVEPSVLNIMKSGSADITLTSTIPFGCYAKLNEEPTGACRHNIIMQYPADSEEQCKISDTYGGSFPKINTKQASCGAEIEGFYPYQTRNGGAMVMEPVNMTLTSPFISYADPTLYRLSLKTQKSGTHLIWKDAWLSEVQVNIITNNNYKKKTCYSHVDPHMQTSDALRYEHNNFPGRFFMYQHTIYKTIQVQMETVSCNNNWAYCACAVAVRAGGDVFLINLCHGSKFIGMTSCGDGGVLVVQEITAYHYEVQTYIGTLITIKILSGRYANLMNIDIQMAPKDYGSTRGLCGTFDGNSGNDYHDRDGVTMNDRIQFIRAWELDEAKGDIGLLDPTCTLNVSSWTESEERMYCTCNCYEDHECGAPESTATCSPSQYVNCTISKLKTTDMCQSFKKACSVTTTTKRSSFYIDPEVEMKRKAALAHKPYSKIVKREATATDVITEEAAMAHCTNTIATATVAKNEDLLGNVNVSQVILECTSDVFLGQDLTWATVHKEATDSVIQTGYKRDFNYTLSHGNDYRDFNMQACTNNCSGAGVCTEQGLCECFDGYFGPDCGNSKSEGPVIEDVQNDGLCDQRYGSECRCFSVQATILAELFMCRRERKMVLLNGEIEDIETDLVKGSYENIYNGECCFDEGRRKRSTDSSTGVQHYQYYVSISNDGVNFGPQTILYVYDSLCLNVTTDNDGNVNFEVTNNTCLIDGDCYNEAETDFTDACNKCIPESSRFHWTYDCSNSSPEDGHTTTIIIAVCAVIGVLLLVLLVIAVVACIMKGNKNNRAITSSQEFTNGLNLMSSRENSRQRFNVKNLAV